MASFAELETRLKDQKAPLPAGAPLPEKEWESLRQAIFGPTGPLAISVEARTFLDQSQRGHLDRLNAAIEKLNATHPAAPARAMVMNDAAQLYNPHVFLRGNPGRPGPAVPRRFLGLLAGKDRKPFQKGSGRLELAQAIADAGNPLTARVLVNRVWLWHFGKGLVSTPSDFGVRSDPPSHPELLDYLASEFIASDWSIKSLHRRIMLSSTYQQRSEPRPDAHERDPETGFSGDSIASGSTSRPCATRCSRFPGPRSHRWRALDADYHQPLLAQAHRLRLYRPAESRWSLSHV